jgi:hypothetical protein
VKAIFRGSAAGQYPMPLSESEMQKARTQADLRADVDSLRDQCGATREGKRAARFGQGKLVKKLEEMTLLALFADAFFNGRSDVLFKPIVADQSYDALLLDPLTGRVLHHLQLTQAFADASGSDASRGYGYQNHLRMCQLDEYGHAPLTGPKLQRNRATGNVPETRAEVVPKSLENIFDGLQSAVERKASTQPEADAFLIVGFEDMSISSESDRAALDRFARSALVPRAGRFATLYLVSGWRRLAFRYRVRGCDRICCRNA